MCRGEGEWQSSLRARGSGSGSGGSPRHREEGRPGSAEKPGGEVDPGSGGEKQAPALQGVGGGDGAQRPPVHLQESGAKTSKEP